MSEPVQLVCGLSGEKLAHAAAACVRSILDSFDPEGRLVLWFLYVDIGAEVRTALERSWSDPRLVVNWVEASEALSPVQEHPMAGSFLRLFVGELLGDVERVIWLDVDLLVFSDITELWNTSLKGNIIGAVPDPFSERTFFWKAALAEKLAIVGLQLDPEHRYFNAGVLLIDLDLWREKDIGQKAFEFYLRHPQLQHLDQDVLNFQLQGQVRYLKAKWNHIEPPALMWEWDPDVFRGLDPVEGLFHPAIRHMAGRCKPWDLSVRYSDRETFYQLLDRTEWRGQRPKHRHRLLIDLLHQWFDLQWLIVRGFWWPRSRTLAARSLVYVLKKPWMIPLIIAYGVRRCVLLSLAELRNMRRRASS